MHKFKRNARNHQIFKILTSSKQNLLKTASGAARAGAQTVTLLWVNPECVQGHTDCKKTFLHHSHQKLVLKEQELYPTCIGSNKRNYSQLSIKTE